MNDEYSVEAEDWESDERRYIEDREAELELNRQSRQIAYEAQARQGFPLGPIPKL